MYCKYCGFELDDMALFCGQCGKSVEKTGATMAREGLSSLEKNDVIKSVYDSKIIIRRDYRKSLCVAWGLSVLTIVFLELLVFIYFLTETYMDEGLLKTLLSIFLIVDVIKIVFLLIKIIVIKRSFVCVTDVGVYGTGCSPSLLKSKPFALKCSDITRVWCKENTLVIESGGEKYVCPIKQPMKTKGVMCKQIVEVYRRNHEHAWVCVECGTVNRYIGDTCSSCMFARKK